MKRRPRESSVCAWELVVEIWGSPEVVLKIDEEEEEVFGGLM